jgi:aminopeptidase N
MIRSIAHAIVLALVVGSLNAQRNKLYKDFDPLDTSDRFNLLSRQGGVSYRLPNETRPIRYDISLQTWIDEGKFEFEGSVRIHLRVESEIDHIVVHSKQLVITETALYDSAMNARAILAPELDPVTEFLTVKVVTGVLAANAEFFLDIKYTGVLRTDDQGFYRSSYMNPQNQVV